MVRRDGQQGSCRDQIAGRASWEGKWRMGGLDVSSMYLRVEAGSSSYRFVCAHLDAHDHNIARRNAQYQTILSHLLFYSSDPLSSPTQVHDSSHLFVMGDLNYRFSAMPSSGYPSEVTSPTDQITIQKERAEMVQLDTIHMRRKLTSEVKR